MISKWSLNQLILPYKNAAEWEMVKRSDSKNPWFLASTILNPLLYNSPTTCNAPGLIPIHWCSGICPLLSVVTLWAVAPLQFVITAPAISPLSLSPGSHSEAPGVQFLSGHMYTGPRWYILAKLVWLWLLPSWVMSPLIWGMLRKLRENYFRYCSISYKTTSE